LHFFGAQLKSISFMMCIFVKGHCITDYNNVRTMIWDESLDYFAEYIVKIITGYPLIHIVKIFSNFLITMVFHISILHEKKEWIKRVKELILFLLVGLKLINNRFYQRAILAKLSLIFIVHFSNSWVILTEINVIHFIIK